MIQRIILLISLLSLPLTLLAGEGNHVDKRLDALLVYGDGFVFSVKEPQGLIGDINEAKRYSANIIFYPKGKLNDTSQTLIRVLIVDKVDENTQKDLAYDMSTYRSKYPEIKFKDISVAHPSYRTFPKLFYIPGQFYEYVTYVNPSPGKKLMFSVSMNKQKTEATPSEFSAYKKVVKSLLLLKSL